MRCIVVKVSRWKKNHILTNYLILIQHHFSFSFCKKVDICLAKDLAFHVLKLWIDSTKLSWIIQHSTFCFSDLVFIE
jgi:hypothetical protein